MAPRAWLGWPADGSAVAVHVVASGELHTFAVGVPLGPMVAPEISHGRVLDAGGATMAPRVAVAPPPNSSAAPDTRFQVYGADVLPGVVFGPAAPVVVVLGAAVVAAAVGPDVGEACGVFAPPQPATASALAASAAVTLQRRVLATSRDFARLRSPGTTASGC